MLGIECCAPAALPFKLASAMTRFRGVSSLESPLYRFPPEELPMVVFLRTLLPISFMSSAMLFII